MATSKTIISANHPDVMISSTFSDLIEHRRAVIDALLRLGFFPRAMEFDSAKAGKTVIESSLDLLSRSKAYIGIISHRYGSVPSDTERNPGKLSIMELEYREALKRQLPVYMFLMSDDHPVKATDVETSGIARRKLKRLRMDVKARSIYSEFSSVEELKSVVLQSMEAFKESIALASSVKQVESSRIIVGEEAEFPTPPQFVAIPNFISGHDFVGRRAELGWLDSWAVGNEPIMLIESIGGTGKSALVWEWLKEHARVVLPGLAGAIWYSFYQGGASMDTFSEHALAYITQKPLAHFKNMESFDRSRQLMRELRERPFLIVLDGLERVLVAYHRLDASLVRDDEVSSASDERACIRPSDESLLRELVGHHASKIVITSRLMPTALANRTNRALIGVRHHQLAGLHPDDALRMMRSTGVHGNDESIRRYLKENFDNHPLMVGIIAGLVNDYIRAPGDFDRWVDDPQAGAAFELSKANVSQRRTHILAVALTGLEPDARQLLCSIAALGGPAEFETVAALSPFVIGQSGGHRIQGGDRSDPHGSKEASSSLPKLVAALQDLEQRGLLQWDRKQNTYDLHPVVRGYAFDILEATERTVICNEIVDHFQSKPSDRYDDARTLSDVQQSIHTFRALVQAGRLDEAASFIIGNFMEALIFSIEAYHEVLALLKPFFLDGFQGPPVPLTATYAGAYLLNSVSISLRKTNRFSLAKDVYDLALRGNLKGRDGREIHSLLVNLALCCFDDGQIASSFVSLELALGLARVMGDKEAKSITNLHLMSLYRRTGNFEKAYAAYEEFRRIGAPAKRYLYRVGDVEAERCWLRFCQGGLNFEELDEAMSRARDGSRETIRSLTRLEGELSLKLGDTDRAVSAFEAAIEMTQSIGIAVNDLEARFALTKAMVGEVDWAIDTCERLKDATQPPHVELAAAYQQIGNKEKAHHHALQGYRWAWSEGPPYSHHWELACCKSVLHILRKPEPKLPGFDPRTARSLLCEKDVRSFNAWLEGDLNEKRTMRPWH